MFFGIFKMKNTIIWVYIQTCVSVLILLAQLFSLNSYNLYLYIEKKLLPKKNSSKCLLLQNTSYNLSQKQ